MSDDALTNGLNGAAADQLCGYVSRIERIQAEIDGLSDDKRDIYAEAKSCGFDKKTLRKLIQRRRKDKNEVQEEDQLLSFYEEVVNRILNAVKDPLA